MFWRMTPRQFGRALAGAAKRHEDEFELATVTAYQAVSIYVQTMNKKRMPKFSDLVRKPSARAVKHGPEHARAALEVLAARMGGKVRRRVSNQEAIK